MTTNKKKSLTVPHLELHTLIGAISYWGSAVRVAIIGFVALAVFLIRILELQGDPTYLTLLSAIVLEGQILIYALVSFLILDAGYVTIAKKYAFRTLVDRLWLLGSEIVLALAYFLPYFVIVSERFINATRYVFVAVLLVVALRLVVGMLYGKARR